MCGLISRKTIDAGANFCIQAASSVLKGASAVAGGLALLHFHHGVAANKEDRYVDLTYKNTSITTWTEQASGGSPNCLMLGAAASALAAVVLHSAGQKIASWGTDKKVHEIKAD